MKQKKTKPATSQQPAPVPVAGLPDWASILILLALPLLLFAPYLTGSKMLFGTDWMSGGYGGRLLMAELTKQFHQLPMWDPYVGSGQPTVASASAADFFYLPTMLLRLIFPVYIVWTYTFIFHLFLAGLGTFYFLKKAVKVDSYPALIGALAYMFTGFLVSHAYAGHDGKLICEAWFPVMMLCLYLGLDRLKFRYFVLAGGALAMAVHSGHVQSAFYSGLISVIYVGYFVWQKRKEHVWHKQVLGYALMLLILVGLAAIYYFPIFANMSQGIRGADKGRDAYQYAASWSMPLVELWDFITPKFVGVLDNYWGPNYFKLHLRYLGILPVLLAVLAVMLAWKQKGTKFWAGLFGFALLMALGGSTPFYHLPYSLLPYVKKFRGPDLIFYVVVFTISVLAAIGLQYIAQQLAADDDQRKKKFTVWLIAGAAALLLVLAVFALGRESITDSLTGHYYPIYSAIWGSDVAAEKTGNIAKNYPDLLGGLFMALLLLAVNGALLVALVRRKINIRVWTIIAGIILLFDLWSADLAFIKSSPAPAEAFPADEVTTFLKGDTTRYRVFPMYYNKAEEPLINHIEVVSGNIPNPLQRYQEFLGSTGALSQAPNLMYPAFLDLLNVKYIIGMTLPQDTMPYDPQSRAMIRSLRAYFSRFTLAFQGQQYAVYRNDHMLKRAWVAPRYQVIASSAQMITALKMMPDPASTALLEKDPRVVLPGTATGTAEVTFFSPNRIEIKASCTAPALLVLSENYHPDWQATVNGRPAQIVPVDHTLRGVFIAAGDNQVVFEYHSRAYAIGKAFTLICIIPLLGAIALVSIRRKQQPIPLPETTVV